MWSAAAALDAELRKRIEIMAEHVARNGAEFESTVKQKNVNNPQFSFLYPGGEGFDYFNHVLSSHRGSPSATPTPNNQSASQQSGSQDHLILLEVLERWKEPQVLPMSGESEAELTQVIASLEQMASRDAIRNGREWIERNTAIATHVAGQMMKRIVLIPTCSHRLHILFLVHDVLQTEAARKETGRPLIRAFKPYLVWIVRPCYQLAIMSSPSGESGNRVLRLLQLWVERGILAAQESDEIRMLVTPPELPGVVNKGVTIPSAGVTQTPRPVAPPQSHSPPQPQQTGNWSSPNNNINYQRQSNWDHPGSGGYQQQQQRPPAQNQQVQIPGALNPGLNGYKPNMLPDIAKQTPETVPVGVLATMIAQFIRHNSKPEFVPYRPLDSAATPQQLPAMEAPSQRLLDRIDDFYQDLRDDEDSSASSSRSSSRSRSRSRSRTPPRSAPQGVVVAPPGAAIAPPSGGFSATPPPSSFGAVPPPVMD